MWHLEYLSKELEKEYLDLILDKVKENRNFISIRGINRYLTDDRLKKILISKPNDLYSNTNEYKTRLFLNNEYDEVINAKSARNKTQRQTELINKYQSLYDLFDYERVIANNRDVSYSIAKIIGQNTCVYCNRQYIFTVDDENNNHITRPEFDHYLNKSKYPFFGLSLYNLIPSCHICNSNCKGTKVLSTEMNPYLTDKKNYFKFSYNIDRKGLPSSIEIKDIDSQKRNEVNELLDCFKIKEIYNCHTNLELKDLYVFATKYSDTYLQEILNKISADFMFNSQEEAYRILFGTELLEQKDNERPLSKFKRDILKELKVIND